MSARAYAATAAEVVATLALALWVGGLVALGAFAAPQVFRIDGNIAGVTMGNIFRAFGELTTILMIGFAFAEIARTVLDGLRGALAKVQAAAAVAVLVGALMPALHYGPKVNNAFEQGVRRGEGEAGATMERAHQRAEQLGKFGVVAGAVWLGVGIAARRRRS